METFMSILGIIVFCLIFIILMSSLVLAGLLFTALIAFILGSITLTVASSTAIVTGKLTKSPIKAVKVFFLILGTLGGYFFGALASEIVKHVISDKQMPQTILEFFAGNLPASIAGMLLGLLSALVFNLLWVKVYNFVLKKVQEYKSKNAKAAE